MKNRARGKRGMAPLALGVVSMVSLLGWSPLGYAQTVTIGALVSGEVTKVYVQPGQVVVKKQPLLEIDDTAWLAKVTLYQARLKQKQLALADAKVELDKQLDLFDRTVAAKRTLDRAQLAYDRLETEVAEAAAALAMVKAQERYYHLHAPFEGRVKRLFTPMGSTVYKENTPMLELERKK